MKLDYTRQYVRNLVRVGSHYSVSTFFYPIAIGISLLALNKYKVLNLPTINIALIAGGTFLGFMLLSILLLPARFKSIEFHKIVENDQGNYEEVDQQNFNRDNESFVSGSTSYGKTQKSGAEVAADSNTIASNSGSIGAGRPEKIERVFEAYKINDESKAEKAFQIIQNANPLSLLAIASVSCVGLAHDVVNYYGK